LSEQWSQAAITSLLLKTGAGMGLAKIDGEKAKPRGPMLKKY
jgi:hypothetical protein